MLSLGSTAILLTVTAVFAAGVSHVSSYGQVPLLLAYSPGGLAEMSLVALSLGIEVAFVAAHHIVRVFIVMLGAAPVSAIYAAFDGTCLVRDQPLWAAQLNRRAYDVRS